MPIILALYEYIMSHIGIFSFRGFSPFYILSSIGNLHDRMFFDLHFWHDTFDTTFCVMTFTSQFIFLSLILCLQNKLKIHFFYVRYLSGLAVF